MKLKTFFNRCSAPGSAVLLLALWISAGCGDSALKLTGDESKAFASAPAETRQLWEKALAAEKQSDFATGQQAFDSLAQMPLSEPQRQAWEKASTAFGLRLFEAARKNDPAAIKVIQDSAQNSHRGNPSAGKK